jgi:pyrrolidone-carboxylate peptidase
MMYIVLHLVAEKGLVTRAGLIPVPAHPTFVTRQNYPFVEMPSMNTELMTAAVKNAIRTSTAIDCDRREPAFNY